MAGLRLAALVLPAIADPARLAEAVTHDQHLMDFLVEEVLTNQPAEVQDFLLRTAIVDRVCAPLADALARSAPPAGSRALLERLVRENLLLEPTGDEEGWFRYHPLFRSLLRHQLALRRAPPSWPISTGGPAPGSPRTTWSTRRFATCSPRATRRRGAPGRARHSSRPRPRGLDRARRLAAAAAGGR